MLQRIYGEFFPKNYIIEQRLGNEDGEGYVFELQSNSRSAACPECRKSSERQHSYQFRRVRDLPILGEAVTLLIYQQRYYCGNEECKTTVFTESNELVNEYSQFTKRCREYMLKIATCMSSESASKILSYQGIRVSGDTLLNMLKEAGAEYSGKVGKNIGIDDWAYRRGQTYGTIICDLDTHEIVEILEGRDSETLEKWLRGHPDIEIVSRDRSNEYASAINNVLPEAIQIADRFHITKNLLDALNETMKGYMPEVIKIPTDESVETEIAKEKPIVKKTQKELSGKHHK